MEKIVPFLVSSTEKRKKKGKNMTILEEKEALKKELLKAKAVITKN